jgi:bifunctional non-homologous end joining protein LigD
MKFEITNPDKVLFPKSGITKKQIIEYYENIAKKIIPHLKDRYLAVQRFPDSIEKEGFYQKNTPKYYPGWIEKKKEKNTNYTLCDNKKCLTYMANQGTIVFHSWLSKKDKPGLPDKIIFDLDPININFEYVIKGALAIKQIVEPELKAYLMTTGSKGLHVVIPIKREHEYNIINNLAFKIAKLITDSNPEKYTLEIRKNKRQGKIFVDYHRNMKGSLAVAPYSLRSTENATIAMPIDWNDARKIQPQDFTIKNYHEYNKNPWKDFFKNAKSVNKLIKKIENLY